MKEFISGLITGILLKDVIINLLQQSAIVFYKFKGNLKSIKSFNYPIENIYFICKITNQKIFNDFFPENKIQPNWKYYSEKQCLKIELDESLVKYLNKNHFNVSFNDFFELNENNQKFITLYLPFFQKFGDNYIYIEYFIDSQKFINIYSNEQILKNTDFELKDTELKRKYSNFICGAIKYGVGNEYISNYFRSFLNNEQLLTPELLLLNYDKLDISDFKLSILNNQKMEMYSKQMHI